MDKVLLRYTNSKSSRYNGKDYWESRSKIRREPGSKGNLAAGEKVTVKTKSRLWKAVVISVDDEPRPKKRRTPKDVSVSDIATPEVPLQGSIFIASFNGLEENTTSSPAPAPVTSAASSDVTLAMNTVLAQPQSTTINSSITHPDQSLSVDTCASTTNPHPTLSVDTCASTTNPHPTLSVDTCASTTNPHPTLSVDTCASTTNPHPTLSVDTCASTTNPHPTLSVDTCASTINPHPTLSVDTCASTTNPHPTLSVDTCASTTDPHPTLSVDTCASTTNPHPTLSVDTCASTTNPHSTLSVDTCASTTDPHPTLSVDTCASTTNPHPTLSVDTCASTTDPHPTLSVDTCASTTDPHPTLSVDTCASTTDPHPTLSVDTCASTTDPHPTSSVDTCASTTNPHSSLIYPSLSGLPVIQSSPVYLLSTAHSNLDSQPLSVDATHHSVLSDFHLNMLSSSISHTVAGSSAESQSKSSSTSNVVSTERFDYMTPDLSLLDDIYCDPSHIHRPNRTEEIKGLKEQMERIERLLTMYLPKMDKIMSVIDGQNHVSRSVIDGGFSERLPLTDLNGRVENCGPGRNEKLNAILNNGLITNAVRLGMELAKELFSKQELATGSLTGRRVHGQCREPLDPTKMRLIDSLVRQKYANIGEAEFASIRSSIRTAIANRCKYLRLKKTPQSHTIL